MPDGRRQILSILIPGDLISLISLFSDRLSFSVQALTEVRSCAFRERQSGLSLGSRIFNSFVKNCIVDAERSDLTVADFGRRSASERVSRFILQLMDRLDERGLVDDLSFAFPLRQQHVADAIVLTTVHVSRVISKFREAGLVEISRDHLKVVNLPELRRIAELK